MKQKGKGRLIKSLSKRRKIIIAVAIAVLVDLSITGYLKFGFYVVKCGGIPVAIGPTTLFQSVYYVPGKYTPGWANTRYACTEKEAQEDYGAVKSLY